MARVSPEHEQVRSLTQAIESVSSQRGPVLPQILPALRELLGADAACAYGVKVDGNRCDPEFVFGEGVHGEFAELTRDFFQRAPIPWGFFDPSRPDPRQQNSVAMMSDLPYDPDKPLPAIAQQLFPKLGLADKDQLRVLVCEGDSLLAWVGAFRSEPFTRREKGMLANLVTPLQQRLTLERRLETGAVHFAALHATLEQLGAAGFVLSARGRIVESNTAGQTLLTLQPGLRESLAGAIRGEPTDFTITRISAAGVADHFLAVRRISRPDAKESAQLAAKRWRLTPRQSEVLALLTEGLSNRAISARLGCSESTVEIHVSAILSKADVESRAALVARVWSQS